MEKRFDYRIRPREIENSVIEPIKSIVTLDRKCPQCGNSSLIKFVNRKVIIGCLVCNWKEQESIEQLIQKAFDNLKRTMDRVAVN